MFKFKMLFNTCIEALLDVKKHKKHFERIEIIFLDRILRAQKGLIPLPIPPSFLSKHVF